MYGFPTHGLRGASPADLAWLSGSWHAQVGEGCVEEHWSPPAANTLLGMFRWVRDGRVLSYEIEVIEQDRDLVYLRVRHFEPKLVGWEAERDGPHEFLLVEADERGAVFFELGKPDPRWAVYRREGLDRLRAYFTHGTEPDPAPGVFAFVRRG